MNRTPRKIAFLQVHFDNQYFTKFKRIPENRGAGLYQLFRDLLIINLRDSAKQRKSQRLSAYISVPLLTFT
jgi:hypothetical protein